MRILVTDGMDKTAMAELREMGHEVVEQFYEPDQLVGKTVVAILNLPPRKMMGLESNGMLLSAVREIDGKEELHLMILDDSVPAGSQLC